MRLLVGFAAILILVSACTSDGSDGPGTSGNTPTVAASTTPSTAPSSEPTTAPPTSKSAPATPTVPADVPTTGPNTKPGETPPVLPVVGTTRTRAGAKAFAEFFIKTIDWAYATTSTTYMRKYFEASCEICRGLAGSINEVAAKNHHHVGDRITIRKATVTPRQRQTFMVKLRLDITSTQVVDTNNRFISGDPARSNYPETLSITFARDGWRVLRMEPR